MVKFICDNPDCKKEVEAKLNTASKEWEKPPWWYKTTVAISTTEWTEVHACSRGCVGAIGKLRGIDITIK